MVLIFGVLLGVLPSPLSSPNLVDLPAYYHVADLIDPHTRDLNNFLSSILKKLMPLVCPSHTDGIGFLKQLSIRFAHEVASHITTSRLSPLSYERLLELPV